MTHLTDEQLADAVDGTLLSAPAAHLAHCSACAGAVEALRLTLDAVRSDDAPEPSPLFWDGFAARVRSAIDAPVLPERAWGSPAWRWGLALAALIVVVLGLQFTMRPTPPQPAGTIVSQHETRPEAPALDDDDTDADEAWSIVASIAAELHVDDAREAGVAPRPGAIDRAATELSPQERAELVRLIEDELKRTGA
jgi:hypothetical protein